MLRQGIVMAVAALGLLGGCGTDETASGLPDVRPPTSPTEKAAAVRAQDFAAAIDSGDAQRACLSSAGRVARALTCSDSPRVPKKFRRHRFDPASFEVDVDVSGEDFVLLVAEARGFDHEAAFIDVRQQPNSKWRVTDIGYGVTG